MNPTSNFIEHAKAHLDQLGKELADLENSMNTAERKADDWSTAQVSKLKKDWEHAKSEISTIAERIETEGESSLEEAKAKAERHWDALQAAVKAYRGHLENSAAR